MPCFFARGRIVERMPTRRLAAALTLAGYVLLAGSGTVAQTGSTSLTAGPTRTIYASVVDDKGVPVPGLTAADFTVKEDGKTQAVVNAEPATTQMTLAIMIDDSGTGLQSMREGAVALLRKLSGAPVGAVALITTGGRNLRAVDYTNSAATFIAGLNKVYARNSSGSFLVDGLTETATEFFRREARRPIIVSMAVEGEEFSQTRSSDAMEAIYRSGAQVYLIRLGRPVIGRSNAAAMERGESNADEMTQANALFAQAPPRSGGRVENLANHTGIPKVMEQIGAELAGQYVVTYVATSLTSPDLKLEVATPKKGLKVRAPSRVGPLK
jgi:VWFA-related protein